MSKTIDERVVQMEFDNRQFESNVQTSMGTLDKLKEALKFDGATKGIDEVGKAAKNCDVSPMGQAVESVKEKFSALEQFAIAAVRNIANDVVNMGKKIVDQFTLAPIRDGFAEYELKMGSVQTIIASTGESIDKVNGYLDELNVYADKTIYSFKDMTSSIGKFTNAGVSLEDAVGAIQGISNEAAVSGANAQEASRAMYNFAQALSAGAVKLIDWKSIENANMATVEFKQSLMDTAVAMGTLVEENGQYATTTTNLQGKVSGAFTATSAFNESLAHQWMTTDVLIQTLRNYSTDIREMSAEELKTYEDKLIEIGYTEEQIKSIEELGKKAFDAAQDVKSFSQLMDTLKEGVGSGWAQTFETLFGNLEEAKALWSGVYKVIGGFIDQTSKARNELLSAWADVGGRINLINALKNVFDGLVSVVSPVANAIKELFPAPTAARLSTLTFHLLKFSENMHLSQKASEGLHNIVKVLLTPFKVFGDILGKIAGVFVKIVPVIGRVTDSFLSLFSTTHLIAAGTENVLFEAQRFKAIDAIRVIIEKFRTALQNAKDGLKEFAEGFKNSEAGQKFAETFSKLAEELDKLKLKAMTFIADSLTKISQLDFKFPDFTRLAEGVLKAATAVAEFFASFASKGFEAFNSFSLKLPDVSGWFETFKGAVSKAKDAIVGFFNQSMPIFSNIGNSISEAFKTAKESLSNLFGKSDFKGFQNLLNTGIMTGIGVGISKFISNISSIVDEGGGIIEKIKGVLEKFGGIGSKIKDVLDGVRGSLESFQAKLKSDVLMKIAAAIAVLTFSLAVLSGIDSEKLGVALTAITGLFADLFGFMAGFEKTMGGVDKKTAKSLQSLSKIFIGISAAVLILSSALKKLSEIDADKLNNGLFALTALLAELTGVALVLSKWGGEIETSSKTLIGLSVAIGILTLSVSKLSEIDTGKLGNGLLAVTLLLSELVAASLLLSNFGGDMKTSALGMIGFAAAIYILSGAVEKLGNMDLKVLGQGLLALAGVMGITVTAFNLLDSDGILKSALAMLVMSGAMAAMGGALKIMGSMGMEEISNGFMAFAGAMSIIVLSFHFLDPDGILKTAAAMLVMSGAMAAMGGALKIMGSMGIAEIAKALIAFGLAMGVIVVSFNLLEGVGTLGIAASMLVMAGAITVFGIALKGLGSMSMAEIAKGLIALVGGFTVLGVAGFVLGPLVPVILGLAAALALMGAAVALVGGGIFSLAAGFAMLAVSGVAGAFALVQIVNVLVGMVPLIATTIAQGIITFGETILNGAATIIQSAVSVVIAICDAIITATPKVVEAAITIVNGFIVALGDILPKVIDLGLNTILGFLQGVASRMTDITKAAADIIINFINGVSAKLPEIIDAAIKMAIAFVNGLAEGIRGNSSAMIDAVKNLFDAVMKLFPKAVQDFIKGGIDLIVGLIKGIDQKVKEAADAAWKIITSCVDKIKEGVEKFKDAAIDCVRGFINGIKEKIDDAVEAVGNLGSKVVGGLKNVLGIDSPSKEFAEIGRFADMGFAQGIEKYTRYAETASYGLGEDAAYALRKALKTASEIANEDLNFNPTITPVIDLTDFRNGIGIMNDAFGQNFDISASLNVARAAVVTRATSSIKDSDSTNSQPASVTQNFTQNNYSPKSLSRMEIYRQTRNQFSAMKGAVAAT